MSAILSPCGTYRYRLERDSRGLHTQDPVHPSWAIIMVNPSTADAEKDDPTIRRLLGFAKRLHVSRLIVGNLFAFRATDVKALRTAADPVGALNRVHLEAIMRDADTVIFAWGPTAKLPQRLRKAWVVADEIALAVGKVPMCWGTAKDGHPRHPLFVPYDQPLVEWVLKA